jgi:hypothetical protein
MPKGALSGVFILPLAHWLLKMRSAAKGQRTQILESASGSEERSLSDTGARDDERLGVFLVLDLAEPGGAVGVRKLEGL